jgi:putative ABC transport system permease protein
LRRWFDAARARLSLLVVGRAAESRMNEELAFHVDMEAQRIVRETNVSFDEARRRALATFGGVTQHREELRAGRGLAWLGTLSLDGRLALRMLRKSPGLTTVAVVGLSVAVAIGCVSFSAIYRIIDARLPVSEGDRVIGIRNIDRRALQDARPTHLHYLPLWREAMAGVAELGAYRNLSRNIVTAEGWSEPARVAEMTASGFRIARVTPVTGRTLVDADERRDAPPVAVIGYRLWEQRYAGRGDVVGRTIQIGEVRHTIVGVMPDGFAFPVNNRIWVPLRLNPAAFPAWHGPSIDIFGRLADDASIDDVARQAELVNRRLAATDSIVHADLYQRVVPYTRTFIDNGDAIWTYHLIQTLVTLLLVVIGTNVAVLVYARTAGRLGEIAIRTALGASRWRIVGQLFAEAFALSLIAVVVGVFLAWTGVKQIDSALQRIMGEQVPYWLRLELTPGVVGYAVVLGILGALIIGVVPALKITGGRVRASLAELSAGGSGLRLGRPWTIMIVAQVAIAVAMLPVAIAGINAWRKADAAQDVLAAKQILTASVSYDAPIGARMDSAEMAVRQVASRSALVERLRANPRVKDVVLASAAPGEEENKWFEPDPTNPAPAKVSEIVVGETLIEPHYIDAVGIPLRAGRAFTIADVDPASNVIIVNQSFIRKVFGGKLAVGARIRLKLRRGDRADTMKSPPWQTIVGVLADFPVDSATSPRVYVPMSSTTSIPVVIAVKMNGGSALEFAPELRRAALSASPSLRLESIRTMAQAIYDSQAPTRLMVVVLELITLSVILLSAAGIYALMSFTVTRRRREIGIRAALGAAPRQLLVAEMARVLSRIAIGIIIGTAIAGVIDAGLNGGWTGRRGVTGLATVVGLMLIVGILSALRPAIGALRIQPTEALRSE